MRRAKIGSKSSLSFAFQVKEDKKNMELEYNPLAEDAPRKIYRRRILQKTKLVQTIRAQVPRYLASWKVS
jgi:hypothetical protein